MNRILAKISLLLLSVGFLFLSIGAQSEPARAGKSLEVAEDDGLPVLIKHLPDWKSVTSSTNFITSSTDLKRAFPTNPILDQIDFTGGTEAVTADYPAGRLLIVEFPGPQASNDADLKILGRLAGSPEPSTIYRRVGNYNVFVFDARDQREALALLDQVRYEKAVQWLGEDPFLMQKIQRYFATTTRDIFISTVLWIVGGLGISVACGLVTGFVFFRLREQQKATRSAYSDAGGLTRLNLDGLSE